MPFPLKYFFYFLFIFANFAHAQLNLKPVALFSFNDAKDYDEVSKTKAKLVGVKFTEDRFNNENSAVYLFGNGNSYINLGNYSSLKQKSGSISIWVKIENEVYAGTGAQVNPIIITKCNNLPDFYESYAIYYELNAKRIAAACTRDSIKQVSIYSMKPFNKLTWHHLIITYNDSLFSFYIDGKLEGSSQKNYQTQFNPLDSVLVGISGSKKNEKFLNGIVDDVAFYDRVLNQNEVRQIFQSPNPNRFRLILTNALNIFGVMVGIAALYFLFRYFLLKKEKEKLLLNNKLLETELRVNRALMNPHFVFNSMNTLQDLILKREIPQANDYLIKFSKLMRKILESNISNLISLEMEIDLIKRYLEIEEMRFVEKISYSIEIADNLASSSICIPVMMIQPFVENAIWHGLLKKTGVKTLRVSFSLVEEKYVLCVIDDNGAGRRKEKRPDGEEKSLATIFIIQRLNLLNKLYQMDCKLVIEDKLPGQGTTVKILLPVLNK